MLCKSEVAKRFGWSTRRERQSVPWWLTLAVGFAGGIVAVAAAVAGWIWLGR
jgi:hypothetical protein